jgi:hypothetical protein
MTYEAAIRPVAEIRTKLSRQQLTGFWGAWAGWTLDGMDSLIYALVLGPALTELLPKSGVKVTPANVGSARSILFALFLVGWGLSFIILRTTLETTSSETPAKRAGARRSTRGHGVPGRCGIDVRCGAR